MTQGDKLTIASLSVGCRRVDSSPQPSIFYHLGSQQILDVVDGDVA